jgi:hypothetical protein
MTGFARREGVEYSAFVGWVLKAARKRALTKRQRFAELRVGPTLASSPATMMEVRLPDGTLVRGANASELAALVKALR